MLQFTTRQAAALAGASIGLINYYYHIRLATPSVQEAGRQGKPRIYSFGDVVLLRVIRHLCEWGVSFKELDPMFALMRDLPDMEDIDEQLMIVFQRKHTPELLLVDDLTRQHLARDAITLVIPLGKIARELKEAVAAA